MRRARSALKEFKRIAMRADKADQSFTAIIHRAAAVISTGLSLVPIHKRLFFRVLEVFCSLTRSFFGRRDGTGLAGCGRRAIWRR
jgi:hypothetical protein